MTTTILFMLFFGVACFLIHALRSYGFKYVFEWENEDEVPESVINKRKIESMIGPIFLITGMGATLTYALLA